MPIAVIPGTNYAYATRDHEGRQALWKIDLADKEDPQLVFASSRVDVRAGLYAGQPDTRRVARFRQQGRVLRRALRRSCSARCSGKLYKDKQYDIADMSEDRKTIVVLLRKRRTRRRNSRCST